MRKSNRKEIHGSDGLDLSGFVCGDLFCRGASAFLHSSLAPALIVIQKCLGARHSGMDCRNPDYMDVFELVIHGTPLPGGYDE